MNTIRYTRTWCAVQSIRFACTELRKALLLFARRRRRGRQLFIYRASGANRRGCLNGITHGNHARCSDIVRRKYLDRQTCRLVRGLLYNKSVALLMLAVYTHTRSHLSELVKHSHSLERAHTRPLTAAGSKFKPIRVGC